MKKSRAAFAGFFRKAEAPKGHQEPEGAPRPASQPEDEARRLAAFGHRASPCSFAFLALPPGLLWQVCRRADVSTLQVLASQQADEVEAAILGGISQHELERHKARGSPPCRSLALVSPLSVEILRVRPLRLSRVAWRPPRLTWQCPARSAAGGAVPQLARGRCRPAPRAGHAPVLGPAAGVRPAAAGGGSQQDLRGGEQEGVAGWRPT